MSETIGLKPALFRLREVFTPPLELTDNIDGPYRKNSPDGKCALTYLKWRGSCHDLEGPEPNSMVSYIAEAVALKSSLPADWLGENVQSRIFEVMRIYGEDPHIAMECVVSNDGVWGIQTIYIGPHGKYDRSLVHSVSAEEAQAYLDVGHFRLDELPLNGIDFPKTLRVFMDQVNQDPAQQQTFQKPILFPTPLPAQ